MEPVEHDPIEAFTRKHERHLINARDILGRDDRLFIDVAEQRDLALDVLIEEAVGPAEKDVGLNADGAQVRHAVLRRLGFELAGGTDERNERQVDIQRVSGRRLWRS